jgi:peptidoglycan/xylan/chitin deacetylase (PgdA/CDA1 family)
MVTPRPHLVLPLLLLASILTSILSAVPASAEPAVSLVVSPGFSPNGDGRHDIARISVRTEGPAEVTVRVLRPAGATVRTLADARPVDGAATYTWRGLNTAGKRMADGRYRVVATARSPEGTAWQRAPVVLDTTPPTFAWRGIAPEPLRTTGPVRFSFATDDRFSERVWIGFVVRNSAWRLVERAELGARLTGERTISWDARAPGLYPIAPGLYRTAVTLRDELGNVRTGPFRPFRSHRPVSSRVLRRVDGAGRRVALTFDDCTYGSSWAKILAALQASRAKATFFCNGVTLAGHVSLARHAVAQGHAIGSHTWSHCAMSGASEWKVRTEVRRDQAAWWNIARATPAPYFRPPGGVIGSTTLSGVGREGFAWTVLWDVDPRDWSGISSSEIQRRVLSRVRPGSIVVLHVKPGAAAAVPGILRGLRAKGLEPVTLTTLLRAGGLVR